VRPRSGRETGLGHTQHQQNWDELLATAEKVTDRGIAQTPALTLIRRHAQGVGKMSEVKANQEKGQRPECRDSRRNPMFFLMFVWWAVLGSNQRPIG
jgi:hypothetical protein